LNDKKTTKQQNIYLPSIAKFKKSHTRIKAFYKF
jgi:hypothetical protein